MRDAEIDGLVTNLVVNGVEVTAYVKAELDRQHPVRLLMRSADPAQLHEAHRQLQSDWTTSIQRLRALPAGAEHVRVAEEWSAVETLRHLVFVHDSWFRHAGLGSAELCTALGLASDFVPDQEEQGLDRTVAPSLDEVVSVREEQAAELDQWLAAVTAEELTAPVPSRAREGWPPAAPDRTAADCLHTVLNEEWAHHRFFVRDLAALDVVPLSSDPPGWS